jgi:hypothetical protein
VGSTTATRSSGFTPAVSSSATAISHASAWSCAYVTCSRLFPSAKEAQASRRTQRGCAAKQLEQICRASAAHRLADRRGSLRNPSRLELRDELGSSSVSLMMRVTSVVVSCMASAPDRRKIG